MGDPLCGLRYACCGPACGPSGRRSLCGRRRSPDPAHDITGKNGRTYRVLLNSEDQRAQVEQAINARIDAGDADLKGKLDLPFPAEVHHPAPPPPPPPPPDTSWGQDLKVAGQGGPPRRRRFPQFPRHCTQSRRAPDPCDHGRPGHDWGRRDHDRRRAYPVRRSADIAPGISSCRCPRRDWRRSVRCCRRRRTVATTALSGASSGLSSDFARQHGFGRGVQTAAGIVGGMVPGAATVRLLARNAPEAALPVASTTAPPPIPRGPMATIARLTGADQDGWRAPRCSAAPRRRDQPL
jgi:hypothetical protein